MIKVTNEVQPETVVWLDLETGGNGLDPAKSEILELALIVSTVDRSGVRRVRSLEWVLGVQTDIATWDPVVVDMHSRNGLIADSVRRKASPYSHFKSDVEHVESEALRALPRHGGNLITLGGNSVHTDLAHLKRHMPKLAACFSHRLLDVSACKIFLRTLGVETEKGEPAHRAMADVNASIAEFEAYQRAVRAWLDGAGAALDAVLTPTTSLEQAETEAVHA